MLLSLNWLKQFIHLPSDTTPEELAVKLKLHTVEVERVERQGALLDHVVVGKVKKVEKHPDADKLKVCVVDVGPSADAPFGMSSGRMQSKSRKLRVVCGGSNVREGMLVAMGMIGAKVRWHGTGEPVELQKTKIRGMESEGMICASDEIGLEHLFPKKEEKEIVDLSFVIPAKAGIQNGMDSRFPASSAGGHGNDKILGLPLAEVLGLNDTIFDIDHKSLSNRPDLWGHYGMAREIAAIFEAPLGTYAPPKIKEGKAMKLDVEVKDAKLCPRYMAVGIAGVKVAPSPDWLKTRLLAVGVRPINNIVDITNYVMLELGQPMHCFDATHLEDTRNKSQDTKIVVRRARDGEKIKALDEREYRLTDEMLVIADEERPIAVAGVIGGEETGGNEKTDTIIFESANFNGRSVRRTAMALGVRTESSARFEKNLDPHNAELALRRAVQLTLELCPSAHVVSKVADVANFHLARGPIAFDFVMIENVVGTSINKVEALGILNRLGFDVKEKKGALSVMVPTWRATGDISIPEDVIEEIVRLYGYDVIPATLPTFTITPPPTDPLRLLGRKVKDVLVHEEGYIEVYNYSFESREWLTRIGVDIKKYLELENPVAKDRPLIRRSIVPNLLENVESNAHRYDEVKLCEIGHVLTLEEAGERVKENSDELLPRQDLHCGVVYAAKNVGMPFYVISNAVAQLFSRLGVEYVLRKAPVKDAPFTPTPKAHMSIYHDNVIGGSLVWGFIHPGRYAEVVVGETVVGRIAELHPLTQEKLGIPYRTAFAELNLDALVPLLTAQSFYTPLSAYPPVLRDIAFVVDRGAEHRAVVDALKKADALVASVELFDVYEGKPFDSAQGKAIPAGKKSMAYHLTYRSDARTLEAGAVDFVHAKVGEMLKKKFGAELRDT